METSASPLITHVLEKSRKGRGKKITSSRFVKTEELPRPAIKTETPI
jgi:hypothetical protein